MDLTERSHGCPVNPDGHVKQQKNLDMDNTWSYYILVQYIVRRSEFSCRQLRTLDQSRVASFWASKI